MTIAQTKAARKEMKNSGRWPTKSAEKYARQRMKVIDKQKAIQGRKGEEKAKTRSERGK